MSEEAKISPTQLQKDLSINDADLDGCMSEQAGLYAYYAQQYALIQCKADTAKSRAECEKAKAYKRHRSRLMARGTKFTESLLEAEVNSDEVYINRLEVVNNLKMKATMAKEALEAFKHRKDMLIQKGVARREELKGETFVKLKEQESAALREKAMSVVRARS